MAGVPTGPTETTSPSVETEEERAVRHRKRLTFDAVADLYEATRRGYPDEAVALLVETAGVGPGGAVLEVGCGTGQLTRQLVPYGFDLTAIDISPAMIELATRVVPAPNVSFLATSFEDFDGGDTVFDLVVSATAWHWLDPEIAYVKAARFLRPGGWLALLATGETYDEPLGSKLRNLWTALSRSAAARGGRAATGRAHDPAGRDLFGPEVSHRYEERLTASAERIDGLERTRATSLDYDPDRAARYDAGLRRLLNDITEIELTQHTSLTLMQLGGGGRL